MIYGPERQLMFAAAPTTEPAGAAAEATRPSKPRTESQRQASRKNGSKSKGPKTTAGKDRSRRNAIKHGLRAETLGPPRDYRGLDRSYRQTVTELDNEFNPRTFTERRLMHDLARDYQRLDYCNRLIDIVEMPPAFRDAALIEEYERHRRAEQDEQATAELLAALRSGEEPDCGPDSAYRLAEHVVGLVEQVEEDWNDEAIEDLAELVKLEAKGELPHEDAGEVKELHELEALARTIKPRRRVLRDDVRLAETFRGERPVVKAEVKTLVTLIAEIHKHTLARLAMTRHVLGRLGKAADDREHMIAMNPQLLFDLEAYHTRLSRAISRKIKSLQAVCR